LPLNQHNLRVDLNKHLSQLIVARREKSLKLSILLLKDRRPDREDILREVSSLTAHGVVVGLSDLGRFFSRPVAEREPSWMSLFRGHLVGGALDLKNASTAAVWLVSREDATFAVCFGYGRNLLKPGAWVEDFGLKVALNSIDPERIRSVDRARFDSIAQQSRIQASREAEIGAFGLDVEQDLLRGVTGRPIDETLARSLSGTDALYVNVTSRLEGIPALLDRYLTQYRSHFYQERFGWVDHLGEVRDPTLRADLDDGLAQKINHRDFDSLWLSVPTLLEWSGIKGFTYSTARSADEFEDLHIVDFLEQHPTRPVHVNMLKNKRVYQIDVATDLPVRNWSIYQCLYCEIEREHNTYLLTSGKWYRIDQDYLSRVNADVAAIPVSTLTLPVYRDSSEFEFSQRAVAGANGAWALMDQDLIRYPGLPDPIEFCDIYTDQSQIIHIKRYGGSSTLSHLFAQGLVSARLFHSDRDFRRAVNDRLPPTHRTFDPDSHLPRDQYEIVYVIISRSSSELHLPIFSRINLRHASRGILPLGYRLSILKVPSQPATPNTPNVLADTA
jgi:uncharacterized protein (TIGR04141 family)